MHYGDDPENEIWEEHIRVATGIVNGFLLGFAFFAGFALAMALHFLLRAHGH